MTPYDKRRLTNPADDLQEVGIEIDKLRSKAAKQADELRKLHRTIEALQDDKALLLSDLNI